MFDLNNCYLKKHECSPLIINDSILDTGLKPVLLPNPVPVDENIGVFPPFLTASNFCLCNSLAFSLILFLASLSCV